MSEIVFRLPSKLPYGYVELRATNEELTHLPDPEMLGAVYAAFVEAYKAGEKAGFERALQRTEVAKSNHLLDPAEMVKGKKPSPLEVPGWGSSDAAAATDRAEAQLDKAVELAANALAAIDNDDLATKILDDTLGVTVLESEDAEAPYSKPAAAVKKPWEKGGAKPKPVPNLFD